MTYVVMTADEHYLPYVPCMIGQLAQHARLAEAVVVVVPPGLPESAVDPVRRASDRMDLDVHVRASALPQTASGFADIGSVAYRSAFATARLYLGETLPEVDRVLYLDVDLLVRAPLDDLLTYPLTAPVAGVQDWPKLADDLFGNAREPYFNSGVLLLSLDRWREAGVSAVGTRLLLEHPEWAYQDQDVLNTIFRGQFETLPQRFNVYNGRQVALTDVDAAIVHFVGPSKPWFAASTTRFADEWRAAQQEADPLWRVGAGDDVAWEARIADALYAIRHSAPGRFARRLIPLRVKEAVDKALKAVSGRNGRARRAVNSGLSGR